MRNLLVLVEKTRGPPAGLDKCVLVLRKNNQGLRLYLENRCWSKEILAMASGGVMKITFVSARIPVVLVCAKSALWVGSPVSTGDSFRAVFVVQTLRLQTVRFCCRNTNHVKVKKVTIRISRRNAGKRRTHEEIRQMHTTEQSVRRRRQVGTLTIKR